MNKKFTLMAGPCLVESQETVSEIESELNRIKNIYDEDIDIIFKGSYRKENRTRAEAFRGIGDIEALKILSSVKSFRVMTDVHSVESIELARGYVHILQVPAFLSRQSDIIEAAAKAGPVNIKKGQFMSHDDAYEAVRKAELAGCSEVYITERGTIFGNYDLVVDMRNFMFLNYKAKAIYDVTHSRGLNDDNQDLVFRMSMAAVAAGAEGLFVETHPSRFIASSDGKRMLDLDRLGSLIDSVIKIWRTVNG